MRGQAVRTRHDPEEAAFDERYRDAARLIAEGRLGRATLLTRETSDRRYRGVQLVIGVFEIEDRRTATPSRARSSTSTSSARRSPGAGGPAAHGRRLDRPARPGERVHRALDRPRTWKCAAIEDRRRIVRRCGTELSSVLARDATVTVAAGHEDRGDDRDRGDREERDEFEHGPLQTCQPFSTSE